MFFVGGGKPTKNGSIIDCKKINSLSKTTFFFRATRPTKEREGQGAPDIAFATTRTVPSQDRSPERESCEREAGAEEAQRRCSAERRPFQSGRASP